MRILIVEDDADTSQFIARGMAELGHEVTLCADGKAGLAEALAGEHETIVLDRMLPALNGLALLKALRAAGRNHASCALNNLLKSANCRRPNRPSCYSSFLMTAPLPLPLEPERLSELRSAGSVGHGGF